MLDATVLRHFYAGAFHPAAGDDAPHANPSDASDIVARVPLGSVADVAHAAGAAAEALPAWRALPGPARAELLYAWADAIAARRDHLASAVTREVGKPIAEARGEVARCITILRYAAGDAVRPMGDVIPAQAAGALQFSMREPLGVVALITPWNFPLAIPMWKAAPALAFGNTIVLKPSEMASHAATLLAATAKDAGIPPGVFNVVLGRGDRIGPALIAHEAVRGVSFTGSRRAGQDVATRAAARGIRHQTEMGGKNAVIVLPDADLSRAAALTAAGAMRYAGQKCTATSRAIVAREVERDFLDALRAEIEKLPLGPVTDPASAVGPLISVSARDRVRQAVTAAAGERVIESRVPEGDGYARGNFVGPTVIRGVPADAPLAQDELFGPVLALLPVSSVEEAIAVANGTPYGLSASLFTRDVSRALQYVREIEVGLVRVNGDTTGVDPHAPFGGMKASSSGTREQGPAAREFYTRVKTVQVNP